MQEDSNRAAEIAWAAGLFEGEGCWYIARPVPTRVQMIAKLSTTDKDVLDRFLRIVGCGFIYGPSRLPASTKPFWNWQLADAHNFRLFGELIRPWMGERRAARLDEVLEAGRNIKARPLRRKSNDYCMRGHLLTEENTVYEKCDRHLSGFSRRCRMCRYERMRNARQGVKK